MKKTRFQFSLVALLALFVLFGAFSSKPAKAAEIYTGNSDTLEGAVSCPLGLNTEYYTTLKGYTGYLSFVTPAQEGFIRVEYKNITMSGWKYCYVKTAAGDTLAYDDRSPGNTANFELESETANNNGAALAPNTRYYIQIGQNDETDISGNAKITVHFTTDLNSDGKAQAETVALNTPYTRSIDSTDLTDEDYFKFTALTSGIHRFTLTNTTVNAWLDYEIRKWNTDELVKNTNNNDVRSDISNGNTATHDMMLEAGQTYYLKVSENRSGNYTFMINNQSVKKITMVSSKNLQVDQSFTLNPVVSPSNAFNQNIEYKSSNGDVATVSSEGVVRAYRPGSAVITATAEDGSNVSAKCTIYVSPYAPGTPYLSKATSTTIKMTWSSVYNASGYYIYRKSGKSWKKIGSTNNATFTVKKLKKATGYQFRVAAYKSMDGKKYVSKLSQTLSVATAPGKSKVRKITKKAKDKGWFSDTYRAKVQWKKVKGASYYELYYTTPGNSYKYLAGTTTGTKITFARSYSHGYTGSKKVNFYVVAVKKYKNNISRSGYSKKKSYRMH